MSTQLGSEPAYQETSPIVKARFQSMRWQAKYRGKSVPTMAELLRLVPKDMRCPICRRPMNWRSYEGRSTMVTLQHDRSGEHRLICHACNTRHAKMEGDSFYTLPANHKRCPKCEEIKPLSQFFKDYSGDRWMNTCTYCKDCTTINRRHWENNNREYRRGRRRAYYHARKNAGNPIPRKPRSLLAELAKEPT